MQLFSRIRRGEVSADEMESVGREGEGYMGFMENWLRKGTPVHGVYGQQNQEPVVEEEVVGEGEGEGHGEGHGEEEALEEQQEEGGHGPEQTLADIPSVPMTPMLTTPPAATPPSDPVRALPEVSEEVAVDFDGWPVLKRQRVGEHGEGSSAGGTQVEGQQECVTQVGGDDVMDAVVGGGMGEDDGGVVTQVEEAGAVVEEAGAVDHDDDVDTDTDQDVPRRGGRDRQPTLCGTGGHKLYTRRPRRTRQP